MQVKKNVESRSQSRYRDWNRKSLGLDIETEESKVSVSVSTTRLTISLYWSRSRDSNPSIANPCDGLYMNALVYSFDKEVWYWIQIYLLILNLHQTLFPNCMCWSHLRLSSMGVNTLNSTIYEYFIFTYLSSPLQNHIP